MTILIKQIIQLIKMLHSETETSPIAWGVAMGFILGMTPAFSLQTILVFLVLFIFRIQIGAAFLAAFFFKFVAFLLDPVFNVIGAQVLQMEALEGVFTQLYNMPIVPLTRFYNSIVMGSAVVSIVLTPFVFYGAKFAVSKYRDTVVAYVSQTKWWKFFKATTVYNLYMKYYSLYGEA
jgi:uncharacterized protein (TIGR03546 family)